MYKTGMPGLSLLFVPLMAMIFPAKESVAILLLLLLIGDCFAVTFYRHYAQLRTIFRLFPGVAVGIGLGSLALSHLDNNTIKPVLGWLVVGMLALDLFRRLHPEKFNAGGVIGSFLVGIIAGCSTTVGNAAGPVMGLYFLMMNLKKTQFMGTFAWFFLTVNVCKVPIYVHLGMINLSTLYLCAMMAPLTIAGALTGKKLLNIIPQKVFEQMILWLSAVSAVWLIVF